LIIPAARKSTQERQNVNRIGIWIKKYIRK
jgi:hypothetical protein